MREHLAAFAPRRHGPPPYRVAVPHGGPGAVGEMAPVARALSALVPSDVHPL